MEPLSSPNRPSVTSPHGGHALAVECVPGAGPTLVWLGGYRSDMRGTKAEVLADLAEREGFAYCRFDYSGHGQSGGDFADGTISKWTEDALAVIGACVSGPMILVGSSMGAWIALRLARHLRERGEGERLRGLLLLAPAPDFTGRLIEPQLSAAQQEALLTQGHFAEPSPYSDEPTIYTRQLMEDGARAQVMDGPIETGCSVHIIQGMEDKEVPHTHALELLAHLPGDGVTLTLVQGGDHRLSRPADLSRMEAAVMSLRREATERDD